MFLVFDQKQFQVHGSTFAYGYKICLFLDNICKQVIEAVVLQIKYPTMALWTCSIFVSGQKQSIACPTSTRSTFECLYKMLLVSGQHL